MKLSLLKSFSVLADCQHFGQAAQRLHLSQPALSKQIQQLEDLIGAPLFKRGPNGSEISELGLDFLHQVRPLLAQASTVLERARKLAHGEAGRLSLGFSFSTIDLISRLLPQFRARYPEVELCMHDLSSADQLDGLLNGNLHLGFVRLPGRPEIDSIKIASDRLTLIVPQSLAGEISGVDAGNLAGLPFIALQRERAPGLHDHIERYCTALGFQPNIVQQANESLILLSLVASGVGIALLHESALHRPFEGVVSYPINDARAQWDVGLAWKRNSANPLVKGFVDLASAHSASSAFCKQAAALAPLKAAS